MKDSRIAVGRGRQLAYADLGDPGGACAFFFHGAPMSRLHLVGLEHAFAAHGVRVVAPDRPSYGRSSPQRARSLADWPADVVALADALGIERFLVAGHSSGGPYALACAAELRERVVGGVVLAGVTDMGWPGAWDGYLEEEARLMRLADEDAVVAACVEHFGADGSGFFEQPFEFPECDHPLLADPSLQQALAEALRQGPAGYAQDVSVQGRPWPFDPRRISAPIEVVHGELDHVVPLAHSRHTADLVPTATLRVLPGHGHLTVVAQLPALASALARGR
jgi:pimeloyl-ACP methyl ester carboxylesterase